MKDFNCPSSKNKRQHESKVIASKTHKRDRRISSVKSMVTKLQKDAEKCYDNAKKPNADIDTLLTKGNASVKAIKGNKDTFK